MSNLQDNNFEAINLFEEENNYKKIDNKRNRAKSKKRHYTWVLKLVVFLTMLAIIAAFVASVIVMIKNRDTKVETVSSEAVTVYTKEQLDAAVMEKLLEANEEADLRVSEKEKEILNKIQFSLEEGNTFVETLRPLYPEDILVVSNGVFNFVPISDMLAQNTYDIENLRVLESGEFQYLNGENVVSHKGIDVSKFQGKINWNSVKSDGVEFAFIRAALRGYGSGKLVEDEYFEENIKGAKAAGIKVGVYLFSQAINEEEILEEANFIFDLIEPYGIECPIVFDVEKVAAKDGRMNDISVEQRTNLTKLFCETVKARGYKPMIYHNMEMSVLMLNLAELEDYDKWFAYYNSDFYYPYAYDVWQYSEKGTVLGIEGNVDLNISFKPLWE